MLTHVQTPSGNLIARHLIDRVTLFPKKSVVVVMDGYGRMLAFIKLEDAAKAERVRDLFNEVVLGKRNAKQPDWSFLTPPAPAVAKAPKVSKLPKAPSDDTDTVTEV